MAELLARDDGPSLYVSGTVSNQGRFYDRFDAVVLLSAPAEVLLSRIENRTTNAYGKSLEHRGLVPRHLADVEPLLREPAPTSSMPPSRSRVASTNSQNSVENLPLGPRAAPWVWQWRLGPTGCRVR